MPKKVAFIHLQDHSVDRHAHFTVQDDEGKKHSIGINDPWAVQFVEHHNSRVIDLLFVNLLIFYIALDLKFAGGNENSRFYFNEKIYCSACVFNQYMLHAGDVGM